MCTAIRGCAFPNVDDKTGLCVRHQTELPHKALNYVQPPEEAVHHDARDRREDDRAARRQLAKSPPPIVDGQFCGCGRAIRHPGQCKVRRAARKIATAAAGTDVPDVIAEVSDVPQTVDVQVEGLRTLWRARLRILDRKDEFLFREREEFGHAAETAQHLLDSSPSANMSGAVIIAVERVAHLWN